MKKINFSGVFKEYSWKTLGIHVGLMITLGLIVVLVFFFAYLPAATNHEQTLTVPNLEGMSYDDLDDFLSKRGLRFEVFDSAYSSIYPPLTVLKQYPESGALVKEGRKIYVTVKAREPQKVKMPPLIDGSLKNAELILKSYGLKRGKITYKPDLAANAVLEQWHEGEKIPSGATVSKGSTIDLVVGDGFGNRQFEVGQFVGRNIEDVEFALSGQGLNTGSVIIQIVDEDELLSIANDHGHTDFADILESGMVIRQNPPPGATVRLGDIVDIWIGVLNEEDSLKILHRHDPL